jgi:G3E family GTPase
VVDASTFLDFSAPEAFGAFFLDQVTNADLVVVNKTDLVSCAEREQVVRRICELNPSALPVETSFCRLEAPLPSGRQKSIPSSNHFEPAMECVSLSPGEPISRRELETFSRALSTGRFGRVFRAKGLLRLAEGGLINLQFAGGRVSATQFSGESRSLLVLIGYDLDRTRIDQFFSKERKSL